LAQRRLAPADLAVEEFLRFISPVQFSKPRFVRKDMELCSVRLKRGDRIIAMLTAANFDPAANEHPEKLDLARRPKRVGRARARARRVAVEAPRGTPMAASDDHARTPKTVPGATAKHAIRPSRPVARPASSGALAQVLRAGNNGSVSRSQARWDAYWKLSPPRDCQAEGEHECC
jgi:Cytochrome P450